MRMNSVSSPNQRDSIPRTTDASILIVLPSGQVETLKGRFRSLAQFVDDTGKMYTLRRDACGRETLLGETATLWETDNSSSSFKRNRLVGQIHLIQEE